MEWLNIAYSIFCLGLMGLGVYRLYPRLRAQALGAYTVPALALKIAGTLMLLCLYKFYYGGGDILCYEQEFQSLTLTLFQNPALYFKILIGTADASELQHFLYAWDIRTWFYVRLVHVLYLLGGNNYFTSGIAFSLLFFLSAFQFANTIVEKFGVTKPIVAISFFVFPSFLLWSSAFLKETVTLAMLYVILDSILRWQRFFRKWYWIPVLLVFLYCCAIIKFYFLAPVLAFSISYVITSWCSEKWKFSAVTAVVFLLVLLSGMCLLASQLHYTMWPEYFARSVWVNYFVSVLNARPGTYFILETIEPNMRGIVNSIPQALMQGLLAPLPNLIRNPFTLLMAIENYVLMLLALLALPKVWKLSAQKLLLVISVLLFIGFTATLLAMTSPNPGNLVRYKVVFFPFWCMIALQGIPEKVFHWFEKSTALK